MEAEANYGAGQLLFLARRFVIEASSASPSIALVRLLKERFGNTITPTLWRYVEQVHPDLPMVGLVTGHPHRSVARLTLIRPNPVGIAYSPQILRSALAT
jgi:hypothetical protein